MVLEAKKNSPTFTASQPFEWTEVSQSITTKNSGQNLECFVSCSKDLFRPYCLLLVALDIGIFTIQSIDAGPNMSWIKTFLYFSVVASLGSIMSAFLLQRKNQEVLRVSYMEACQLMNRFRDASGLYSL
ncbi:uncharacterized protein EV420DRAFT_1485655 [Desarmillaria tabescens]|uniref:Uncharacterized protein n=1 Tax=Armillaria tabescens TaxID=1929756 RepID=A0AA39MP64_ARMTA|nr:uncharacterized protein EV420DRAFT_1485655 [Desarmillaria tabescens]KAK0441497.1 hypothetical protein EV420DRAFT_1485655 [Desarmillaria tabescens]